VLGLDERATLAAMERVNAKMAALFTAWSGQSAAALFRPSLPGV
jgi:hypothetical protein